MEAFMSARKNHMTAAAFAALCLFFTGTASAQGIPVIDAAGLVQHIQGQMTRELMNATTRQIHNEAVATTSNTLQAIRQLESGAINRHDFAARENSERTEAARRAAAAVWDAAKDEVASQALLISSHQSGRIHGNQGGSAGISAAQAQLDYHALSNLYSKARTSVVGAAHDGLNRIEDHLKSSEEQRRDAAQAAASSEGANQAGQANALLQSNAIQTQNATLSLLAQNRRDEMYQRELDDEMRKVANMAGHAQFAQDRAQARSWYVPIGK